MVSIQISDFDLGQICDSGQCFRMYRVEDDRQKSTGMEEEYEIIAGDKYLRVGQNINSEDSNTDPQNSFNPLKSRKIVFDCSEDEYETFWKHYFDIDETTDYHQIKSMVPSEDKYLLECITTGWGIRILNQDLWEMIVSFLISQQNNIPRIHKCIDNISHKYGEGKTNSLGEVYYSFPTPESLATLGEDALMECNLGYRSKYVVRTAREILEGKFNLDEVYKLNYPEARTKLLEMYGVGVKVADCICLFALHHLESFPIDTHIKQVLEREYRMNPKDLTIESFSSQDCNPLARFAGVQGVIQQYIFYAELQFSKKNH